MNNPLHTLTIGHKVSLLVSVFLILALTLAAFSIHKTDLLGDQIREIAEQDIPIVYTLTQITTLHTQRGQWLQKAARTTPPTLTTAQNEFNRLSTQFAQLVAKGLHDTQTMPQQQRQTDGNKHKEINSHLNNINQLSQDYNTHAIPLMEALSRQDHAGIATLLPELESKHATLEWELVTFLNNLEIFTEQAVLDVEREEQSTLRSLQLMILIGMTIGTLLSLLIVRMITGPLMSLSHTMQEVTRNNDFTREVTVMGSDEVALAGEAFNRLAARTRDHHWLKGNIARLNDTVQSAMNPQRLAHALLKEAMAVSESAQGAIYFLQDGDFHLAASSGLEESPRSRFRMNEGVSGRCAAERRTLLLENLPPDYGMIHSALGQAPPRAVVAMPMIYKEEVLGVLEMASFTPYSRLLLETLDTLSRSSGMSLKQLLQAEATLKLLEETRHQAAELASQQAELEEQAQSLKASEEELRAQNEELEESQEQLERQNAELESTQRELEDNAERLTQASRYKSEFLANMSHELRTPLNSLLLLSRSLASNPEGNLSAEQLKTVEIIHNSGHDLLHLINDILDLAKVEAGRMDLQVAPLELRPFMDDVHAAFQPVAHSRALAFTTTVATATPAHLPTDGRRLKQILHNLLSNAFKFTPQGRVALRVAPVDSGRLAFTVQDSGIGIAAAKRDMIFEAFQQGDGAITRQYGGTGLGLSISRALADLLGGEIRLESEEGRGSTFTLLLPLAGSEDMPTPPDPLPPPAPSDDRDSINPADDTILIIEDDALFAAEVARIAHARGCRVLAASGGEEGLTLAARFKPRGIILDLGLPDMDGAQVQRRLAADPFTRHIPIHVVSARDPDHGAADPNVVGHLVKPAGGEGIRQAMDRLLDAQGISTRKALLVSDDRHVHEEVAGLLNERGVRMVLAETVAQARECLLGHAWDCVILHLPKGNHEKMTLLAPDHPPLPSLILYSDQALSGEQHRQARLHTDSIIVRGEKAQDRLRADLLLFLHSVKKKTPSPEAAHGDAVFQGRKVLIVDDDVRNAYALAKALKGKGLLVVMAADGEKALEILAKEPDIAVALMDVMMPVMDGYQAMRAIRADVRFRGLAILALTAKAMPGDREDALAAGANDYLSKPVDEDRLFALLRVWLQAKGTS